MQSPTQHEFSFAQPAVLTVTITALLLFSTLALAQPVHEKVIYSFQSGADGEGPYAGLLADSSGNLYGTTVYGGSSACVSGCGTVFELSPPATSGGAWTKTLLYSFQGSNDGAYPLGSLAFDQAGNIFGTTNAGDGVTTNGTVFELSPPTTVGGAWTHTTLYGFPSDGSQGMYPSGNLAIDANGNLYGTTRVGGPVCCENGTVFQLSPPATTGGAWTETVISVEYVPENSPWSGVVLHHGVLYGTTTYGGPAGLNGIVYQLALVKGQWTTTLVYSFGKDIGQPVGAVAFDAAGNIYGTAWGTGRHGCDNQQACGGVYELLAPSSPSGAWTGKALYYFAPGKGGSNPRGSLLVDSAGRLYGTDSAGGLVSKGEQTGNGTVFELIPPAPGASKWTEVTIHDFSGTAYGDGSNPDSNLIFAKGKMFGTTYAGGADGYGSVYSLSVQP